MKKVIGILIAAIVLNSCYYDIEEQLYPPSGNCDLTGVTYSATVVPILQSNGCLGCHAGAAPSGNISLDGYSNAKAMALNGKLYGSISHSSGFSAMPQGGNKMSTCNISRIKAWIDAGAPNN